MRGGTPPGIHLCWFKRSVHHMHTFLVQNRSVPAAAAVEGLQKTPPAAAAAPAPKNANSKLNNVLAIHQGPKSLKQNFKQIILKKVIKFSKAHMYHPKKVHILATASITICID